MHCRGIQTALTARWPRVRYAIVANRLARWTLPLLLPARWVDWMMANTLNMLPGSLSSAKAGDTGAIKKTNGKHE